MYLDTRNKAECFGCEACVQACVKKALTMVEDCEGFRYPVVETDKCITCGICRSVCPCNHFSIKSENNRYVFGGYNKDTRTRFESTSGGAFSAIVDAFCDKEYAVFGAEARGLKVFHSYITNKKELGKYRQSKYSQSIIGLAFKNTRLFLEEGKKVLFSGTPCQVAGLLSYLELTDADTQKLLTVDVVCEGVPSPLYVRKLNKEIERKYGSSVDSLEYRYTGNSFLSKGKWDFQIMRITLEDNKKVKEKDRWFNPFWSLWLQHLMSRPSCYKCPFATQNRVSDITLGDLWGVHIYCPELYGGNGGSSLVLCNTEKGKKVFSKAQNNMYGHELLFEEALKYQSPLRSNIAENPDRTAFFSDLQSSMDYRAINNKWAKKPSLKLLFQKYFWGNRQKVIIWYLKQVVLVKKGIS